MALSASSRETYTNPEFIVGRPEDVVLADAPINRDWIVSGNPQARSGLHSPSVDGQASTHIWECTAGSFWWTFYDDETVVILEGAVEITAPNGEERTLQPGDIAYFAQGTTAFWNIENRVKKIAFLRSKPMGPVQALRSVLGKMRRAAMPDRPSVRVLGLLGVTLPL